MPTKLVRSAVFRIDPDPRLDALLAMFRSMINDAIRVGLSTQPKSRFQLRKTVYEDLRRRYGLHSHYVHNACEVAYSIIRKHTRWGRAPVAKHLMLKLDSESYWVNHMLLRIPTRPGEYLFIPLRGGDYQLSQLDNSSLKKGSVTITQGRVAIAMSQELEPSPSEGAVAYDINLRNITGVSTSSTVPIRFDTSKIPRIVDYYREVVSNFRRNDIRVSCRIRAKYGAIERSKVQAILHKASKDIVTGAASGKQTIVLERLKYLRTKHKKGSSENKRTREQLNRWSYRVLQHMIEYKAAWNQVPTAHVSPSNSSRRCSICGMINKNLATERAWQCPNCGAMLDRDVNAAVNLLMSFLKRDETPRFRADWLADEAMRRRATATNSEEQMPASRQGDDRIVAQLGRQNRGLA